MIVVRRRDTFLCGRGNHAQRFYATASAASHEACSSHPDVGMSTENRENDINQNGKREHEHPHGQSLPHQPVPTVPRQDEKREGKTGQPNFIPGETPVGEPGKKQSGAPSK